jgi:hypothetical protein
VDAFKTWEWKKKKKIDKQHFFSSQFLSLLGRNNLIGSNFFFPKERKTSMGIQQTTLFVIFVSALDCLRF